MSKYGVSYKHKSAFIIKNLKRKRAKQMKKSKKLISLITAAVLLLSSSAYAAEGLADAIDIGEIADSVISDPLPVQKQATPKIIEHE